ncbi:Pre-mRNA-splicing factor [Geranomyces michiganensis]|nr:Pre-mRNA-splicing factor [Geranomyces michiganensis]
MVDVDMTKPARRQISGPARATVNVEQGGSFNIWYNRWQGEGRRHKALEKAERRCNMRKDSGYTKAQPGSIFCIHFSRGCCSRGDQCQYWHRPPIAADREDQTHDCFGRERFREDREDMGGIGSFERDNRTLYVGNIKAPITEMEEVVRRHFGDWGEIEHLNILHHKNVAFVRYVRRYNAEFAREAMYGQSLDSNEVLNVRWATEDPNPHVKAIKKRKVEEHITDTVQRSLPQIGPMGTILDYENYYSAGHQAHPQHHQLAIADASIMPRPPPAKVARREEEEESETFAALAAASNEVYEENGGGEGGGGGGEPSADGAAAGGAAATADGGSYQVGPDGTYGGWIWDGIGWRYVGDASASASADDEAYRAWYYSQTGASADAAAAQSDEAPAAAAADSSGEPMKSPPPAAPSARKDKEAAADDKAGALSALAGYASDEEEEDEET